MVNNRKAIGINGKPILIKNTLNAKIKPWFDSHQFIEEEFWVTSDIEEWQNSMRTLSTDTLSVQKEQNIDDVLDANPNITGSNEVQAVLGVNVFAKILNEVIRERDSGTITLNTMFGKVTMGERMCEGAVGMNNALAVEDCTAEKLNLLLQKFWQLDEIGCLKTRTNEEQIVEDHFMRTHKRDRDGRYVVVMPMKENFEKIGSSREIALKRFYMLEKKLSKQDDLKQKYIDFMREYEHLGHMRKIAGKVGENKAIYYIPHHCVTGKFRVVFDASCKTNRGISLNEVQMLGEKMQRDLHEIVMRFRRHKVAIVADIKMMFRQVKIAREQWNLQRIFWRERPEDKLTEYWLTVNTYGMTSAAHNAIRSMVQCARENKEKYPTAADVIENDMYMDDCATGASAEQKAISLAKDIDTVLKTAGFELRKWKSNCGELVKVMAGEDANTVAFDDQGKEKILGLKWLINTDEFIFAVKTPEIEGKLTKRKIVSCVAQLYDPNGFVAPITILGKILIQDTWRLSIDWDEEVTQEIRTQWEKFWEDILHLEKFKIKRWLQVTEKEKIEIHGFSDASTKAYGGVIYVRKEEPNGKVTVTLLIAKTRVAPLKTITVPRLELAAAELLSRMVNETIKTMEWENTAYTLWTDSMVTLHWLHKLPCSLKTFVANRVSSIQTNTDIKRWRHVSTKENPADLLSRGLTAKDLVDSKIWLNGPEWLALQPSEWPSNTFVPNVSDAGRVEWKAANAIRKFEDPLTIYSPTLKKTMSLMNCFEKLEKVINVLVYVFKFIKALRKRENKRRSKRRKIDCENTNEERVKAMTYLIRKTQEEHFAKEISEMAEKDTLPGKSKIEPLKPILDREGVLRVGGRLQHAELSYETKHPAIIPNGSRLAWLIIENAHRCTKHGATQVMTQFIRERYWIPRIRSMIKSHIHKCVVCVRQQHKFEDQLMADLPKDRVTCGKPFLVAGVDFAGPFRVRMVNRQGKEIVQKKCWIAIFVCLKTRAVHIDIVSDLTTVAFIACFERFVARRGRCSRIYSDNGTTFKGTQRELKTAYEKWKGKETEEYLGAKGTEWRFMAPAAPHQGGIYEAAVKSMKYHMTRIIGIQILGFEQLQTLLTGIEAILNSRPLHPLSDDPTDMQALTPGHFLVGEPLVLPLPFDITDNPEIDGVRLWKERKRMLEHFWARWREEYLATLQERKKWRKEKEPLKAGQLVLIKCENLPPAAWSLGRIKELLVSHDGRIRNVIVKTEDGEYKRAVQRLCIIPMENNNK